MFDNLLAAMHLSDYDDDFDDDFEDEEEVSSFRSKKNSREVQEDKPRSSSKQADRGDLKPAKPAKITPMRSKSKGGSAMEVCVIKPSSFEDSKEISETLLAERTVLLNMKGLDLGVAQRIIDFTCGTCYAIDGTLQRVEDYLFIATPSGVELSGDLAGFVESFDFTGIQTGF